MIRNYRQIAKTGSNLAAWGSGRSQIISPVRDSMILNIKGVLPFNIKENVTNYIDETLNLFIPTGEPVKFRLIEEVTIYIDDDSVIT